MKTCSIISSRTGVRLTGPWTSLLPFWKISYSQSVIKIWHFAYGLHFLLPILSYYPEIFFSFVFPVLPIALQLKRKFNKQKDNNFAVYYFISSRTNLTNSSALFVYILYLQATTVSFALIVAKPFYAYLTLNHFSLVYPSNSWLHFWILISLLRALWIYGPQSCLYRYLQVNSNSRDQTAPSPTATSPDGKENTIFLSHLCSEHFNHFSEPQLLLTPQRFSVVATGFYYWRNKVTHSLNKQEMQRSNLQKEWRNILFRY